MNSLLPGRVGDQDVKDCYQAFQECLQTFPKLNQEKAVLFGGSHGGFLVTHLAGKYHKAHSLNRSNDHLLMFFIPQKTMGF